MHELPNETLAAGVVVLNGLNKIAHTKCDASSTRLTEDTFKRFNFPTDAADKFQRHSSMRGVNSSSPFGPNTAFQEPLALMLVLMPELAWAHGGPASMAFMALVSVAVGLIVIALLVATVASKCTQKIERRPVFVAVFIGWTVWGVVAIALWNVTNLPLIPLLVFPAFVLWGFLIRSKRQGKSVWVASEEC